MKGKYLVFIGMGFELVGIMLACLYVGQKLDQKYSLNGIGIATLSILGLAGWLIRIVKLAKKMEQ